MTGHVRKKAQRWYTKVKYPLQRCFRDSARTVITAVSPIYCSRHQRKVYTRFYTPHEVDTYFFKFLCNLDSKLSFRNTRLEVPNSTNERSHYMVIQDLGRVVTDTSKGRLYKC